MDLSQVLMKVMALYGHVNELENKMQDLLNEIQMLITTKAEANEIKIDDPDA